MEAPKNPEFWRHAAGTKTFTHPLDHARFTNALSRDARILDFGCGQGRLCAELAEPGYKSVVGVDSSAPMIPEWFDELLAGMNIEEKVERDAMTMNGNPARIVQLLPESRLTAQECR